MTDNSIIIFLALTALIGIISDFLFTIFIWATHLQIATLISACAVGGAWGEVQEATVLVLVGLLDLCIGLVGAVRIMKSAESCGRD